MEPDFALLYVWMYVSKAHLCNVVVARCYGAESLGGQYLRRGSRVAFLGTISFLVLQKFFLSKILKKLSVPDWDKRQNGGHWLVKCSGTNVRDKRQTLHSDWLSSVIGKASMCSTDVAALPRIGDPANALTPLKFAVSGIWYLNSQSQNLKKAPK